MSSNPNFGYILYIYPAYILKNCIVWPVAAYDISVNFLYYYDECLRAIQRQSKAALLSTENGKIDTPTLNQMISGRVILQ
jgi:hypothetical protein